MSRKTVVALMILTFILVFALSCASHTALRRSAVTESRFPDHLLLKSARASYVLGNNTTADVNDSQPYYEDTDPPVYYDDSDETSKSDKVLGLPRSQIWIVFVFVGVIIFMFAVIIFKILSDRKKKLLGEQGPEDPFMSEMGMFMKYNEKGLLSMKVDKKKEKIDRFLENSKRNHKIYMKTVYRRKKT